MIRATGCDKTQPGSGSSSMSVLSMSVAAGYLLMIGGALMLCASIISFGMSLFAYRRLRDTLKVFFAFPFACAILLLATSIGYGMTGLPDIPPVSFESILWGVGGLFAAGVAFGIASRVKRGPMPG